MKIHDQLNLLRVIDKRKNSCAIIKLIEKEPSSEINSFSKYWGGVVKTVEEAPGTPQSRQRTEDMEHLMPRIQTTLTLLPDNHVRHIKKLLNQCLILIKKNLDFVISFGTGNNMYSHMYIYT